MALLSKQSPGLPSSALNMATASGGGDTVVAEPGLTLVVRNGDGSAKTITLVDPRTTYGVANPDPATTVGAGATHIIPIPPEFADANGVVSITYSAVTSVTVAAVRRV